MSTNGGCGRHVKLPEGKTLVPGLISHATNVVEHPELVAERIVRLAKLVGRDNVIACNRLRLRAGAVHAARASVDSVGEAWLIGRGRKACLAGIVAAERGVVFPRMYCSRE